MTIEKRDFWWTLGMAMVFSGLDKRGWSHPVSAALAALAGAGLGFLISRVTRRTDKAKI